MTSAQIRQAFLDFFRQKQHTIVSSGSLMPDSPNLLFTNAGMNQFVPIFLGQIECPYSPGRAADTQKCIRAGGKHNDLDDVGLDTYHHTFFEMLGNWSFGDYFKKEAIAWAWELIIDVWKFPAERVYATIYQPEKAKGDPADRDQEAWDLWAAHFRSVGLDPDTHIVNGNKKDNFWMMGDTGPCGPCTEIHVDLTPGPVHTSLDRQREGAKLVNGPDARCIEIWNNVFIQYNANPDGTFTPLPAQHVDTGMGFERVVSIIQGTKNFTDFENARISNYDTDVFRPLFDEIETLSGCKYTSTLPLAGSTGDTEQEKVDIAFRVIADHIRTLSFAIADGIQPGNTDRNYVLRRILRRAVRYGRTLGFREPFFYKLVDVLARHMGDVFPELRTRQTIIKETLKREEEAFNRTLDKGIALFEEEATRATGGTANTQTSAGSARVPRVVAGVSPGTSPQTEGTQYHPRRLPHFERPWAKYLITFTTKDHRQLTPAARTITLDAIRHFDGQRYALYAAVVMPDHVHILFEPSIKEKDADGNLVFWPLSELLHSIKSFTSHKIQNAEGGAGVWEKEWHDRMIRSESDLDEKFVYVVENPQRKNLVVGVEEYEWAWTAPSPRRDAGDNTRDACATQCTPLASGAVAASSEIAAGAISGAFAFRLYDEQGFPLDLTELMARERGLTVDVVGFEKLMQEQRARARAAQKKQIIELSQIETTTPTNFLGYDALTTEATVLEVVALKDKTAVVLDATTAYAEMGGQVGDSGEIVLGADTWRISNTQKSGNTWLHFLEGVDAPAVGARVTLAVEARRRHAIERHHSVTHLLHWALREVVSHEPTQKGSAVNPEKLTFDFNSAALTTQQVRDIERLVNERILENAPVIWTETPYAEVKGRADIMQFFGDKYGDVVRVVDIGGYSKELCAGTHVRSTGEIGLFRIASEAAIAAGVRRIEAVAGLSAYDSALTDSLRLADLAGKVGAPLGDLEKKIDAILAHQKELERTLKAAQQREASARAKDLLATVEKDAIVANLGDLDADAVMHIAEALKGMFPGIAVLGAASGGAVTLIASVGKEHQARVQAGKIISAIAPIVGGKGGGKPDFARGGGKDASRLAEALAHARTLL